MDLKKTMDELDELHVCLHEQTEGAVGGPLHIITDDGNFRDSDIAYCWRSVEDERDVVVRVLAREMLQRLVQLTAPQRLVWWLRKRICTLGIDDVALAAQVRDGVVDRQSNSPYDDRIMLGKQFVWEGLEQLEALWRTEHWKALAKIQPQNLFSPRHMIMPVETAAELMKTSAEELTGLIKSGQCPRLKLIETPEGVYVEYEKSV